MTGRWGAWLFIPQLCVIFGCHDFAVNFLIGTPRRMHLFISLGEEAP